MNTMTDLEFFIQLMKLGSLVTTAREHGVAPSTVSKRLAAIEARLSVRLLNRTTRRMSLTAEGEIYLSEGVRLAAQLKELEQTLSGAHATPRGLLRVNATLGFGRQHIAPAVSDFAVSYPEVDLLLHLSDHAVNQIEQGFDVAIRIGELADSRLTARRIAANNRILCASPDYLNKRGTPTRLFELHQHDCLVIRESHETFGVWKLSADSRTESIKIRGRLSTNDGTTALCWALNGQGIVLRSRWDVARHLKTGQLRHVLPEWSARPADIMAVFPTRQNLSAKTRAFVDFLVQRFKDKNFS